MKIGIVTVLYNSEKVLDDFFRTLDEQTFKDFILYVIDNSSSDNSLFVAESLSREVNFKTIILPQSENWGVAKGNNIGIDAALADGCDYILLSNNDIVLNPDTIQNLQAGMQQTGATMAVPKIYFHDTGLIWHVGGSFSYYKGITLHRGSGQQDRGQFNKICSIEYAPTCFMLIHSDVFTRVGKMDEKYFVYYDDSDFVWRAVKKGHERLVYIPFSSLQHKESTCTGGNRSVFSLYYVYRNSIYFVRKNMKFPRKQLTLLYSALHTMIRKPFYYDKKQMQLIKKALRDGKNIQIE